ncbi:MAG: phage antirepressor KilAC domain-containing protein [Fuerstiella sp.]
MAKIITESDVYRLVMRSKLPSATKFQAWVFDEVLPSIRKHGTYQLPQKPMTEREMMMGYLAALEREERLLSKIEEDAPKVEFYASPDVCQMAVAAQTAGLEMGRNRLYERLRSDKILITGGDRHNLPYQTYVDSGLFVVKESTVVNQTTRISRLCQTTYVTQKGLDWLIRRYSN